MQHARPVFLCLALAGATVAACGDGDDATAPDNQAPTAQFTAACTEFTCTFTESSTDPDGNIAGWSWDFGDQTAPSADQNPVHTYAASGVYDVTLTVTDDEGETGAQTQTIAAGTEITTAVDPLVLDEAAGFRAVLTASATCEARGNTFRITAPVNSTLTTDGCYDQIGKEVVHPGPYPAGTAISVEITSPVLSGPPRVQIDGAYPEWTIRLEDGPDADFDDMVVTVTALP